jgi:ribosomal protein L13
MFFLSQQRHSKNNPKNMLNKYIEQMLKNRTTTKNMLKKWYLFFDAILTHPHQFTGSELFSENLTEYRPSALIGIRH